MSEKRCDQCQHWTEDEESWEAQGIGFKRCAAVKERWRIQDAVGTKNDEPIEDDASEKWIASRKKALSDARAYVEDGSEYKALLWTAPDFFCALFEEKSGPSSGTE